MYTVTSTWYVEAGKEEKARIALQKLAADVEANERDTLLYLVHVPDEDAPGMPPVPAGQVFFFEGYRDHDAFLAHLSGAAFTGFLKESGALFVQNQSGEAFLTAETLCRLGGFIRSEAAD